METVIKDLVYQGHASVPAPSIAMENVLVEAIKKALFFLSQAGFDASVETYGYVDKEWTRVVIVSDCALVYVDNDYPIRVRSERFE